MPSKNCGKFWKPRLKEISHCGNVSIFSQSLRSSLFEWSLLTTKVAKDTNPEMRLGESFKYLFYFRRRRLNLGTWRNYSRIIKTGYKVLRHQISENFDHSTHFILSI